MYNRRILINEDDRSQILNMHKNHAKRHGLNFGTLNEQEVQQELAGVTVTAPRKGWKDFQQWVIYRSNKPDAKTILGKGGDSGFGDDGKLGQNTKAAWNKYGNDYKRDQESVASLPTNKVTGIDSQGNAITQQQGGGGGNALDPFLEKIIESYKKQDGDYYDPVNWVMADVPNGTIYLTSEDTLMSKLTGQCVKVSKYAKHKSEDATKESQAWWCLNGNSYRVSVRSDGNAYGYLLETLTLVNGQSPGQAPESVTINDNCSPQTTAQQGQTTTQQGQTTTQQGGGGVASSIAAAQGTMNTQLEACKTKFPNIGNIQDYNVALRVCNWGDTTDGQYILNLKPEQRETGMDLLEKRRNKNNPETRALRKEIRTALGMAADTRIGRFGQKVQGAVQGAVQGFQQAGQQPPAV